MNNKVIFIKNAKSIIENIKINSKIAKITQKPIKETYKETLFWTNKNL